MDIIDYMASPVTGYMVFLHQACKSHPQAKVRSFYLTSRYQIYALLAPRRQGTISGPGVLAVASPDQTLQCQRLTS